MSVYRSKSQRGTPPAWYAWIAPSTGLAALLVSLLSVAISLNSYRLADRNRTDAASPKLAITKVKLSTSAKATLKDKPIVTYQVENHGLLTISDVHTSILYLYDTGTIIDQPLSRISINNEGLSQGATLVSGDELNKSFVLTATAKHSTPSYKALSDGLASLEVQVFTQSSDATSKRIATCDKFAYRLTTDDFEHTGTCPAIDFIELFRHQLPSQNIAPPQDSRLR